MARMYPERLPITAKSDAERRIFGLLETQLDDSYTVLAQVAWQWPNGRGQVRDGEADLVILHPTRGILVLEIKGGTIEIDGATGHWRSIDRNGRVHQIKDPTQQATRAFHTLREMAASTKSTAAFQYTGGHGVIFPDGIIQAAQLPPSLPRPMLIDASDLNDLNKRITGMYAHANGGQASPIGADGIKALVNLLAPSWRVAPNLAVRLSREQDLFQALTEQQFQILGLLNNHKRALIEGCAGSGKTFLAMEKARRLADQGFNTLLTCFNKSLGTWMQVELSPLPDNLRVQHFHELAFEMAGDAGLDNLKPTDMTDGQFFNDHLPTLLLEAREAGAPSFDAIVVDEGQDFQDDWWISLLELLTDPDDGIFYVFYDPQQSIYTNQQSMPFDATPFRLSVNMRNTQAIHDEIAAFYPGEISCNGPDGEPPTVIATDDFPRTLQSQLRRLIIEQGVRSSDIVILTPASQRRSCWKHGQRIGPYEISWQQPKQNRQIQVATIHGFKGLERPVAIITEEDGPLDRDLRLVAYSRPSSELIIIRRPSEP